MQQMIRLSPVEFNKLKSFVFGVQKDFFRCLPELGFIVYHPGAAIGHFAAQQLKIPVFSATPFPMYQQGEYLLYLLQCAASRKKIQLSDLDLRADHGSASISPLKTVLGKRNLGRLQRILQTHSTTDHKRITHIISCSEFVFPTPRTARKTSHTGYWFLDDVKDWNPSARIVGLPAKGKQAHIRRLRQR